MIYFVSESVGAVGRGRRGGWSYGRSKDPLRLNAPSSFYKVHFCKGSKVVACVCHLAAINNIHFKGISHG